MAEKQPLKITDKRRQKGAVRDPFAEADMEMGGELGETAGTFPIQFVNQVRRGLAGRPEPKENR